MLIFFECLIGICIANACVLFFFLNLDYRISERTLQIEFKGIRIRRIRLDDIDHISKRRHGFAENWSNSIQFKKRRLVIHRKSGWFKSLVITPENRYKFKHRLEQAIRAGSASGSTAGAAAIDGERKIDEKM